MSYLVGWAYRPFIYAFDLLGKFVLMPLCFKRRRAFPEKANKVLFIRLEHIGDMIMASPVFESWKKSHPGCKVHVLCRKLTAPLLKNNPFVDKAITYEAPWFIRRGKTHNAQGKSIASLIRELRTEKYDLVFEMHGDPRNNYLAWRTGAYSIGYSCRGGGFFLDETAPYSGKLQMVQQNLLLVKKHCTTTSISSRTKIYPDRAAVQECAAIMRRHGLKRKGFIMLHPGSGRQEKDLTDVEVENALRTANKLKIVITGSVEETARNSKWAGRTGISGIADLRGKTSLLCLAELVKNARKVIAPDTSIIHVAKAVGTPYEAVYKTTDPKVWGY